MGGEAAKGATADSTPGDREPDGYAYYVLWLLFFVYVVNFIDRQIFAVVLEDIKQEYQVSDTAMGFLSGPAFALFYTFAGIPIARWADRGSRRLIIALGIAVWSAMTAASGLARSFSHLALARVGVGVGEAAGTPPSHSLISDYFPPERRATALSIYSMGVYVGVMLGYLFGGPIKEAFDWRATFLALGLPGILLAFVVRFTIREPERGRWESAASREEQHSVREVAAFLATRRSFVFIVLAGCLQSISAYAFLSWSFTFLLRVHEMQAIEISLWLGLATGLGGIVGAAAGGLITDRFAARDQRAAMFLASTVAALGVPFAVGFALLGDRTLALLCFVPYNLLQAMYVGPMFSTVQSLVRPDMRATTSAIMLFLLNIAGAVVGPMVVGSLSDSLSASHGQEAIRYALALVGIFGGFGALFFALATRTVREELREAAG
ncbi:MAG: MFS transporter [Deltaproteobacteria bacterium]|nr:MFS transporter [Deltaproteobacteria bacterium]MBW2418325.1 MFS transporter [Deltaproteobacteria bacterium]